MAPWPSFDLFCISLCGHQTVMLNSFVNYKASRNKIQFRTEKCKKLHIGKSRQEHKCGPLFINGLKEVFDESNTENQNARKDFFQNKIIMEEKSEEKYLEDIISNNGKKYQKYENEAKQRTGYVY